MKSSQASLLLVDDEEMNRDMLGRRLQLHGYTIACAENGRQALDLLERQDFDLILLDVMMPEINGLQVLRGLRATRPAAELPVIMVTAKDQNEDIVEAFRLGANDYITKPINFPVALARIATQVHLKKVQAALRASETRYALAARGANDGLWDWDLQTDEIYYSPRWKAMIGCGEEEIAATPDAWLSRAHPEDRARLQEQLAAHRQGLTPHFESEHRLLHKDHTYRWVLGRGLAVRNKAGDATRLAGSLTDITQGKVADPLTGLPNRVRFMDRLARVMERARRRPDDGFAVLFLDLDRFKLVNDSLGHLIGDQLLTGIARRLETCLRASDTVARLEGDTCTVARLGGDEFTILLDHISHADDAIRVADRIQQELALPFHLSGHEVFTSASIGIALAGNGCDWSDDLLRDADTALYCAKANGKARHAVFDAPMRARAVDRLQLETDLRRAIDRQEFCLHYQPILELATDRVVGLEALVRWRHPQRGLVYPANFIPAAEETGLIVPLGWWVLHEACRQMSVWRARYPTEPPLVVSVNLACKQFAQPDLVTGIERLLEQTGLDPHGLKLEITESAIMDNPDAAALLLERLRALGMSVGIDDFGTGYSSLSHLHQFPIDTLKIDRSFVMQMDRSAAIVSAIITLAHHLDMDVIAEGVETIEHLTRLKSLGCEYAQGYYFAKPLDAAAAEAFLTANSHRREVSPC